MMPPSSSTSKNSGSKSSSTPSGKSTSSSKSTPSAKATPSAKSTPSAKATPSGKVGKNKQGTTNGKSPAASTRPTLTELSQNTDEFSQLQGMGLSNTAKGLILGELTLRFTPETLHQLEKNKQNVKEYLNNNLDETGYLEIVGWSNGKHIPSSLYDELFTSDLQVKRLALRGRGIWDTCHCPSEQSKCAELIDTTKKENITNLEHLYIFRTFNISSCALLDLISRSPNLKTVRFYGVLSLEEHFQPFRSVRFLGELDGVYWPWCNRRHHIQTLKTLVLRNDTITTFYSPGEIACDLISADLFPNLKYLSLILNESWSCKPGRTKKANRLLKKISYLSQVTQVEALEVRTFDIKLDDQENDSDTNLNVRRIYESYQLAFWDNVAKLSNLKYLAIYGAWELDKVSRELSKHGLQIEYFRTNLIPSSLIPGVDSREDFLTLSLSDTVKQLVKLAKLKSIHFSCHENLGNIDVETISALKEVCDMIWRFDIRICFSQEVEELLTNILRRGNQQGRNYRIKVHIEPDDEKYAAYYVETVEKYSATTTIREKLNALAQAETKERFGKTSFKVLHIWGIEQAGGIRDTASSDQLKSIWDFYNDKFKPLDMFI